MVEVFFCFWMRPCVIATVERDSVKSSGVLSGPATFLAPRATGDGPRSGACQDYGFPCHRTAAAMSVGTTVVGGRQSARC